MNSLPTPSRIKVFLIMFLPAVMLYLFLWCGIALQQKRLYSTEIETHEQEIVLLAKQLFETGLTDLLSDTLMLAGMLRAELPENREPQHLAGMRIDSIFAYMKNKKTCDQVRYIDSTGMERVRVNWDEKEGAAVVPASALQYKGDRYYFKKGMEKGRSLYISRFDLNIEHNEIEQPFKPMIRITHNLLSRGGGQPQVLIVLNALGARFIRQLSTAESNSLGKIYLVNDRGDWLKGPSPDAEWQFMFQKRASDTMALRYPHEWQRIGSQGDGQFRSQAGLFTYDTVDLKAAGHQLGAAVSSVDAEECWKIVGFVPKELLVPPWWMSAAVGLGLGIFIIGIVTLYMAGLRVRRSAAIHKLVENEKKFNVITGAVQDAIVMIDASGRVAFWNQAAERIFGFSATEIIGHDIHEFITPQDQRPMAGQGLKSFAVSGQGRFVGALREVKAMRKDGVRFPAELNLNAVHMEGQWWGVGVVRDITDRHGAEEKLKRSEKRLREAQSIAHVGNWEWIIAENNLYWSDEVYRIFGLSPQEFQPSYEIFLNFVHQEDRSMVDQAVNGALTEQAGYDVEHRICLGDGSERIVRERGQIYKDQGGRPVRMVGTVQDVTELKRAEAALRKSHEILENRVVERTQELKKANEVLKSKIDELERAEFELKKLSLAIEQSPSPVMITDLEGTIEYANPSFTRITGYTVQEALGKNPRIIKSDTHPPEFYKDLWRTISSGNVWRGEICNRKKDGAFYWELASISPVRNIQGEVTHYVAVKEDITERKQKEYELQKAKEQADIANRAKSNFLARMSHEIRTPMNGVLGLVEVLSHSELSPRQADLVTTIRTSAGHLLHLIDDVLDFSKIEVDQLELEHGTVRVADLVENITRTLAGLTLQQHVALRLFVSPRLPEHIFGDENRLRQVVYNLVGNAIKFSAGRPEKPGQVEVRAEMQAADPPLLRFTVTDNGIGIPPAMMEKLFKPFTQADSTITRRFGGTGLGLAICKRLVELMGGQIAVNSAPGEGTTFTVLLPLEAVAEQPDKTLAQKLAGIRCILLPSQSYIADDLQEYLEHAGAEVLRPAADQIEALIAGADKETVLVRDAGDRQTAPSDSSLRQVLITHGRRVNPRLIGAGTVNIDTDVLRYANLVRAVGLAAGRVLEEAKPAKSARRTAAPVNTEKERAADRLILVAEDDIVNQKVILQQLDLLGYAAEVANDGAEALRLWQEGRYGLLLADLHMPAMDGYELTRAIRAEEAKAATAGKKASRLPILALTADATRNGKEDAAAVGMDAFLTKPIFLEKLRAALEPLLPPSRPRSGARQPEQDDWITTGQTRPVVDLSIIRSLIGDDPQLLRQSLHDYLENAGESAGKIEAAAAIGDIAHVGAIAHRLKSSSRSIGALALGSLCADLENASKRGDGALVAVHIEEFKRLYTELVAELVHLLGEADNESE